MERVFKAEMWDKMQYLFRNYYDRMMHCVLFYPAPLDEDALRRALEFQISHVPVLHSRYHNNFIKPYWVLQEWTLDDALTVDDTDDLEGRAKAFAEQRIPIESNVQIRIGLFRCKERRALVFVVNHMCFDGGDLKYFVTQLAKNYTVLVNGGEEMHIKEGTRAYDAVYSGLSEEDAKKARSLYRNISEVKSKHTFPLTPASDGDVNRIIMRKLSAEKFAAARAAGKKYGFTVNDLILAVYLRSLYDIGVFKEGETLTVPCMVDLRRHMKEGGAETGLTNHTGFMTVAVKSVGKDMRETLDIVAEAMKANKQDKFLGLYSLPLLHLAYTVFPHCLSEAAIKLGYDNPLIGMSNIGSIKPAEYSFGSVAPYDGFYTGAVKGKPYMQLALTTFEGEVTFTIAITGNEKDEEIVNAFFDVMMKNVDEVIKCA